MIKIVKTCNCVAGIRLEERKETIFTTDGDAQTFLLQREYACAECLATFPVEEVVRKLSGERQ